MHKIPNTTCSFNINGIVLKREDYVPVSYDAVKNKYIFGEMKDTIDGKFVYLGCL